MQFVIARVSLLSAILVLSANTLKATPFDINNTNTTPQSLGTAGGETGTVESTGNLSVSGNNIAVSFLAGTSTLNNSGTIQTTSIITGTNAGKNRALRNNVAGATITINNLSTGLIKTVGADAYQMNVAGSTVTFNNYGTVSATGAGDQAINWNYGFGSTGLVTPASNFLYNYYSGSITAVTADTIRPNAGATIYNSGTIASSGPAGDTSSSDAIDAQVNNTGVTIINGASQTTGSGATNLIEGERHGITGGQQTDTIDTAGSTGGNKNGVYDLPFTMSITNNAGARIIGDNGSGVNIDGVDGTEQVTIVNGGLITGNGSTRDGDGVDIDGVVNINNTGTIHSLNASNATYNTVVNGSLDLSLETSEGVTVGGGTIINSGTIEGSATTDARGFVSAVGRGITLAGIDHTTTNAVDTNVAIQKTYSNPFSADGTSSNNPTGASYITNKAGGLIKGDSDAGIAIAGSSTSGTSYAVVITNNALATIEGNSSTIAVIDGSAAVGGTVSPIASSNNETIINYGTIRQDGAGKAISLGSGTNDVQILGGVASVNGDISGGTSAGSNTLEIDPTAGQSFSYGHVLSNFNTVSLKSGTITLSGASTYTGNTTVSGGTSYINNASGSGTGSGKVSVTSGATLGGSGTISGAVSSSGTIASGAAQGTGYAGSANNDGKVNQSGTGGGLTLCSTLGVNGGSSLTFALGAGNSTGTTFANPNTNSTYLTANGGIGSITFGTGSTIGINLVDLAATSSSSDTLQLRNQSPYLLITAGSTLSADLAFNLVTTGGYDANGYVLGIDTNTTPGQAQGSAQPYESNSFALAVLDPSNGNQITGSQNYNNLQLYLNNGDLEVIPEPSTTSMLILAGLGGAAFAWKRKHSPKA